MTDIAFSTATELAAQIKARKIGCRELLDHFLARIERHDKAINAVVVRAFDQARKRADAADAALVKGESWGPLHGVPVTVKEAFNLAGQPTSWGAPTFKNNIAGSNAVLVDRMIEAGAVVFGKTNLPYMLLDLQSYNDIYGCTSNPWNLEYTPGGSSGGAAAAVAAGFTGFDIGSDLGGSIRIPSHFCGIYGHKPTWNILPTRGHALGDYLSPVDIMVVGPMARGADDLALALQTLGGADGPEADGWKLDLPKPRKTRLADFRIAVWIEDDNCPIDESVAKPLRALVENLEKAGAVVDRKARPAFDPNLSLEIYYPLMMGVTTAGMPQKDYDKAIARADAVPADDKSMGARLARCTVQRHRDWVFAHEARTRLKYAWRDFFKDYDAVLMPVGPVAAYKHDHSPAGQRVVQVNGKPTPYWDGIYWAQFAGVGQLPATVAPIGRTDQGLPVGVQIVGPAFGDLSTIALAGLIAKEFGGGFVPPPGLD